MCHGPAQKLNEFAAPLTDGSRHAEFESRPVSAHLLHNASKTPPAIRHRCYYAPLPVLPDQARRLRQTQSRDLAQVRSERMLMEQS
jgi:hypothetical protein